MSRLLFCSLAASSLLPLLPAADYTSQSYAQQSHLVAQWDGIENAGVGRHDAHATVWKDLRGNYDMTLTSSGCWNALGNALYARGIGAQARTDAPLYKTIEIVFRSGDTGGRLMFVGGWKSRIACFDSNDSTSKKLYFDGRTETKYIRWPASTTAISSAAATYADSTSEATVKAVYLDGTSREDGNVKNEWGSGDGKIAIGNRKLQQESQYAWTGEIFSIRLYDTELTDDEIAANAAIDEARFKAKASARYVQDGLVAQWDGIDNAGTGVHDPTAAVWKDLAGDLDLTLTDAGGWNAKSNALVVSGISARGTAKTPAYKTIEVVYRRTDSNGRLLLSSGRNTRFVIFNKGATASIYFSGVMNTPYFTKKHDANEIVFLAARYDDADTVTDIACDGGPVATSPMANDWSAGSVAELGGRTGSSYPWYGEIHAIRLYSRRLTAAELARNNEIDRQRFLAQDSYRGRDALIANWSGENNFAPGVAHNPRTTVWKDLAGTYNLTLTTNGSWTAAGNGLVMTRNGASAYGSAAAPFYRTIEVAYRGMPGAGQGSILFSSGNTADQLVWFKWSGGAAFFAGSYNYDHLQVSLDADTCLTEVRTLAATYTNAAPTATAVYGNGTKRNDGTYADGWKINKRFIIVGDNDLPCYRPGLGDVYAIRLYNRELTDAEIAFNSAMDLKRVAAAPKTVAWGGGDGDFGTASNWTDGALPRYADDVTIGSGTVTVREDRVVGSLTLGAEAALALTVSDAAVPLTVGGALTAEAGAGLVLEAAAFGRKHACESVTLVSCAKNSAAALGTLAANVSYLNTPAHRRGTLSVVDGAHLVYRAPAKPGTAIFIR